MYPTYLASIATLQFSVLIPMGIGLVIGCAFFLVVIKLLLKLFYMPTYYSIIGFTLGSVLVLYHPIYFDFAGFASIILFVIGFKVAGKLEKN